MEDTHALTRMYRIFGGSLVAAAVFLGLALTVEPWCFLGVLLLPPVWLAAIVRFALWSDTNGPLPAPPIPLPVSAPAPRADEGRIAA